MMDLYGRILQDNLLRLSALGYEGKIEFCIKGGYTLKTLSSSGSIPFSEMSGFTTPEVYKQQFGDYVSTYIEQ